LGKWRHPATRNILLGGINLNYIDDDQMLRLRKELPKILAPKNLKSRYWRGKALLPDVFNSYYRTYDRDYVSTLSRDTIKFYPTPEELEKSEAETQAQKDLSKAGIPSAKPEIQAAKPAVAGPKPGIAAEPETPEIKPEKLKIQKPEKEMPSEKPETKPEAEPEIGIETKPESGKEKTAEVEPTVEKTPIERGAGIQQQQQQPKTVKKDKSEPSSVQRRKKAKEIKKAIEQQKIAKPPPKQEPPEEIKGALGLFKKK
jgi:hypothetical protein